MYEDPYIPAPFVTPVSPGPEREPAQPYPVADPVERQVTAERPARSARRQYIGRRIGSLLFMSTSLATGAASLASVHDEALALYAEAATDFGWLGAEATDDLSERRQAEIREHRLELNEAELLETVQTDSGITLEIFQSGLDDNPERPITVNEDALNDNLNFVIDNLHLLDQNLIDQDTITNFQQRANAGELDNITFTTIVSTDADHCIPRNTPDATGGFAEALGTSECNTVGLCVSSITGEKTEGRTLNPVLLVTPNKQELEIREAGPAGDGDMSAERSLASLPLTLTGVSPQQAMASIYRHELGHAVINTMGATPTEEEAHIQIIEPLTSAGDTFMSSGALESPFDFVA